MKILIIEDDENIARILSSNLEKWGYQVCAAKDFNNIMETFHRFKPQLVLLDIVLPFFNGYYWSGEIRKVSTVPIIFISSKSEDMDIVMGMQSGGDDYITKPLNMNVLIAKVQAMLRRSYNFVNEIEYLKFGDIQLYLSENRVECAGLSVELTKTELLILDALFRKQGAVSGREEIMERCWQGDNFIDDNTLAVNMTRLRKKLQTIGLEGLIKTKKGRGYFLEREI
ncbi:MAG: response regulator transcription factor [Hornefia sp.]|nr:response regulator transcription factor [Hornefia sp.]